MPSKVIAWLVSRLAFWGEGCAIGCVRLLTLQPDSSKMMSRGAVMPVADSRHTVEGESKLRGHLTGMPRPRLRCRSILMVTPLAITAHAKASDFDDAGGDCR